MEVTPMQPSYRDSEAAKTDALGRRLDSGAHYVCVALAEAGDEGISASELEQAAAKLAEADGVTPRGAVPTQLQDMKRNEGVADNDGPKGWRLTQRGRKLWSEGKPTMREALRESYK